MKKLIISCVVCLLLSVVLVGCGKKPSTGAGSGTSDDIKISFDENGTTANSAVLEQVAQEASASEDIAKLKESLGNKVDITITVKGDALVYTYTYTSDVGDVAVAKTQIEEAATSVQSVFEDVVTKLKGLNVADASVVTTYLNHDGTEIFTKEYK